VLRLEERGEVRCCLRGAPRLLLQHANERGQQLAFGRLVVPEPEDVLHEHGQ
jgi:hypothetical protein